MPAKFLTSKIFIGLLAAIFVAGGGYSVWRHQQAAEKPLAEINIKDTGKFKLADEAVKKPVKKSATPAAKPLASVVKTIVPEPSPVPAPVPASIPVSAPVPAPVSETPPQPQPDPTPSPAPASVQEPVPPPTQVSEPAPQPPPEPSPAPEPEPEPVKVVIFEIQTGTEAGGTEDEFVKIYNPTSAEIDLSGWALKKKTSSGSLQNLVSSGAFSGKIAAKSYFVIAHANYKGVLTVNLSYSANSNNLSYTNNSAVLYDVDGNIMDEVQWTEIPKDQIWQRP